MKSGDDYIKEYCKKCHLYKGSCPNDYGDSSSLSKCYPLLEIMRKESNYRVEDLKSDLERLDKKANLLETLKLETDEQAKIVAPIYLAKRVEFYMKYFECKIPVKVEEK